MSIRKRTWIGRLPGHNLDTPSKFCNSQSVDAEPHSEGATNYCNIKREIRIIWHFHNEIIHLNWHQSYWCQKNVSCRNLEGIRTLHFFPLSILKTWLLYGISPTEISKIFSEYNTDMTVMWHLQRYFWNIFKKYMHNMISNKCSIVINYKITLTSHVPVYCISDWLLLCNIRVQYLCQLSIPAWIGAYNQYFTKKFQIQTLSPVLLYIIS